MNNTALKKELKIYFSDFWGDLNKQDNLFINLLKRYYTVVVSEDPDVLFYSCYGFEYIKYRCFKIFYTAENVRPDFLECDFSLSFDYDDYNNKNLRLPLYRWRGDLEDLTCLKDVEQILQEKKRFCCMVVSNPHGKERNTFFEKLSAYKRVDSGGKHYNNIGYNLQDKMSFIKEYKFTISFENSSYPGYTTEKIVEPMLVNSIPVYWGNTKIADEFNTRSFINIHDYESFDDAIKEIIKVDNDNNLYRQYLVQPYFINNRMPENLDLGIISEKLFTIVESFKIPISTSRFKNRLYSYSNMYRRKLYSKLLHRPHWYC